jgi:hypothetical protein
MVDIISLVPEQALVVSETIAFSYYSGIVAGKTTGTYTGEPGVEGK